MSLASWLKGDSLKPSSKRGCDDSNSESISPPSKKHFSKEMNQASFDWYVQDDKKLWHCKLCRECKLDSAYAEGHEKPAKTTNHMRHAACKYSL